MSSYLSSYFGTATSSYGQHSQQYPSQQPQQQYNPSQAPQSSTWTSTFSSRIATLRKALTKDSEEDDVENEDCSHVSNVLRAYYVEKGRPFPEWLPADPKRPAVQTPGQQYGQYGNTYINQSGADMTHGRGGSGGRGGLSDLWDSGPSQVAAPATQSLRAPRAAPQSLRSHDTGSRQGSSESHTSQGANTARPLPSQRVGSYQTAAAANPPVVGSRDRLRARLQGGNSGRNSPAPSYNDQGAYGHGDSGTSGQTSASQPWSNNSSSQEYDPYRSHPSTGSSGNLAYRQRPGGPR